jgi:hypothetical protein
MAEESVIKDVAKRLRSAVRKSSALAGSIATKTRSMLPASKTSFIRPKRGSYAAHSLRGYVAMTFRDLPEPHFPKLARYAIKSLSSSLDKLAVRPSGINEPASVRVASWDFGSVVTVPTAMSRRPSSESLSLVL